MTLEEICELLYQKRLNSKCNHYIISSLTEEEIAFLLQEMPKETKLLLPKGEFDADIVSTHLDNIAIDGSKVPVRDILSYTLFHLDINQTLPFSSRMALLRFRGILRENQKMIQLFFYKLENYTIEDQKLLNELFWFNTYLWNANLFLQEENLTTYQTQKGEMLDSRENYQKIYIRKENK